MTDFLVSQIQTGNCIVLDLVSESNAGQVFTDGEANRQAEESGWGWCHSRSVSMSPSAKDNKTHKSALKFVFSYLFVRL